MSESAGKPPTVSSEIREMLLREFLKKHGFQSEEDAGVQFKNGRIVLDRIDEIFANGKQASKAGSDPISGGHCPRDIPLEELTVDQEERFQSSMQSSKHSKRLADTMFTARLPNFTLVEKNDTLSKIRRLETHCSEASQLIINSKHDFYSMIELNDAEPDISAVKTKTIDLLHGTVYLIRSQTSLMKLEAGLSNDFSSYAQKRIAKHFQQVKSKAAPDAVKTIAQVYKYLAGKGTISIQDTTGLTFEEFQKMQAAFDEDLAKKRIMIDKLEKVIEFINTILNELQSSDKGNANKAKQPASKEAKPAQKSASRMSVIGSVLRRFGRSSKS